MLKQSEKFIPSPGNQFLEQETFQDDTRSTEQNIQYNERCNELKTRERDGDSFKRNYFI